MKAIVIFLCFVPLLAFADGIPYNARTQRVTVPHETFTLTAPQQHEAGTLYRVTLTAPQRARLKTRWPRFPDTIQQILPYDWSDCTCVVGHPWAILLPGGTSIALTHGEAEFVSRYGSIPASTPPSPKPQSAWKRFWTRLRG